MLINEADSRSQGIDIRLAALMSSVAGAINAAGFEAAGLFSANMTGNVSALADHLALGQPGMAAVFALVVVIFVAGALAAGLVIEGGLARGWRGVYAWTVLGEAGILALLWAAGLVFPVLTQGVVLITVLGFVLGLQNATTTRISRARIRSTHVSGMATDIGLELAALVGRRGAVDHHRVMLRLHLVSIVAFLGGGVVGALLHARHGAITFLCAAAVLAAIALPEALRARDPRRV